VAASVGVYFCICGSCEKYQVLGVPMAKSLYYLPWPHKGFLSYLIRHRSLGSTGHWGSGQRWGRRSLVGGRILGVAALQGVAIAHEEGQHHSQAIDDLRRVQQFVAHVAPFISNLFREKTQPMALTSRFRMRSHQVRISPTVLLLEMAFLVVNCDGWLEKGYSVRYIKKWGKKLQNV